MDREKMLSDLKAIKTPVITEYGAYDTGIEFRILTSQAGYFCMGPGHWPIEGPVQYSSELIEMVEKIKNTGFAIHELTEWFGSFDELVEEVDLKGVTSQEEIELLNRLDDLELSILIDLVNEGKSGNVEYYYFDDIWGDGRTFFLNYKDAEKYLIDIYTAEGGSAWESMDDRELDEWHAYLEL